MIWLWAITVLRGLSSAGRATESHSVGHRFDPDRLHHSLCVPHLVLALIRYDLGALAQLGEHLLCKQRVIGSIPIGSTIESWFVLGAGETLRWSV